MFQTHIFFRCTHPKLEQARNGIWDRPDEEGIIMTRPTSVGQLLGKSQWEKRLPDWIMTTGVGLLGCAIRDFEAERVERYDGWQREPFVWEEIGYAYEKHSPGFVFSLIFTFFKFVLRLL
jgi:hypothetical protein